MINFIFWWIVAGILGCLLWYGISGDSNRKTNYTMVLCIKSDNEFVHVTLKVDNVAELESWYINKQLFTGDLVEATGIPQAEIDVMRYVCEAGDYSKLFTISNVSTLRLYDRLLTDDEVRMLFAYEVRRLYNE